MGRCGDAEQHGLGTLLPPAAFGISSSPHPLIPASPHLRAIPYFARITRTLSNGIAGTVRPRLVTVVAMNIEL
jgi:hypothetical protein